MVLSFRVLSPGAWQDKIFSISKFPFLIGRAPECHLRPVSRLVSKRHCALILREGKVFVQDFGSTAGTQLNDQPVQVAAELQHQQRLRIGPLVLQVLLKRDAVTVGGQPAAVTDPSPPSVGEQPVEIATEEEAAALLLAGSSKEDLTLDSDESGIVPPEIGKSEKVKEPPPEKSPSGNTSQAAQDLLRKYQRPWPNR